MGTGAGAGAVRAGRWLTTEWRRRAHCLFRFCCPGRAPHLETLGRTRTNGLQGSCGTDRGKSRGEPFPPLHGVGPVRAMWTKSGDGTVPFVVFPAVAEVRQLMPPGPPHPRSCPCGPQFDRPGSFLPQRCSPAARPRRPSSRLQDDATLRALFDSVAAEVSSARWESWAGHYAPGAYLQPPNAPTVRGRDAILAWGKAFPKVESLTFRDVQVAGEGNIAYGSSSYALKLQDAPPDTGKQLVVFRRARGAAWEVHAVSFSSDLPPAAPPAGPVRRQP